MSEEEERGFLSAEEAKEHRARSRPPGCTRGPNCWVERGAGCYQHIPGMPDGAASSAAKSQAIPLTVAVGLTAALPTIGPVLSPADASCVTGRVNRTREQ